MEEKYVASNRGRVYYWVSEPKQESRGRLVFLPGLTANHHLYDSQVRYFVKEYSVLVWDAPAHGKSRPYRDFTYPNSAEELKGILDQEGWSGVVLVGQSAGGFVAQSFIKKYPEEVTGLLTIGTCPYGTDYYSKSDIFWLKQTEWMLRLFPDRLLRSSVARMCSVTAEGRENMLSMLSGYEKKELCHLMYLGFAGFIPEIEDLKLTCPVSLVVGDKDRTGKVREYNERWHEREGYPLHIIKESSHNVNDDQPDELNRIIEAFVREL